MKRILPIFLALLLILTACGKEEQAPAPEPESRPSSASEPAPEPPAPEPSAPEPEPESRSSSVSEPVPEPEPTPEAELDTSALTAHAKALTEHIVSTVFEPRKVQLGDYPTLELDPERFTAFAMGVLLHREEAAYQYHDIAVLDNEGYWHFPKERLKALLWEVFNVQDWEPDRENWRLDFNEDEQEYIIDLAFDFWNYMECRFTATDIDTQNMEVIVDYDLYTSSLFPNPEKMATVSTTYSILFREDGTPYLRYTGTVAEPVPQ